MLLNKSSKIEVIDDTATLQRGRTRSLLLGFVLAMVTAGPAMAGPTGGNVVGGQATISDGVNLTEINQATNRVSINWDTFDVAANETVRFVQPSSTSVALNTIFDQNASQIFGAIDANGRVLLINPNGMIFSPTAQVNVAGLIASSLNISTADFMAGNYSFESAGGSGGLILNQGSLQAAPGGFIALLGEAVANEGLIVADAGTVAMAAGSKVALDFDGSGLLYFAVESDVLNGALGADDAISNSGSLFADGGQVLLTAAAAQDVYTRAINNDGLIQARRIENIDGVIRLSGGSGTTVNTGTLDASGDASSDGGSIHVTGNYVGLAGDAILSADGGQNGGQILVGGAYQGNDTNVQNAERTYVGSDVSISANAGANGNGGEVIVWADDVTRFYGNISATGGSNSGDGGFSEVSGLNTLGFFGMVDLSAANGAYGTLLLDPTVLEILGGDGGGVLPLDASLPVIDFGEGAATDFVSAEAIEGQAADVFLRATDSIIVRDLNLNLGGDGDITMLNPVSITLETRNETASGDGAGTISFDDPTNSIVTIGGGGITITAGTIGTAGGAITSTGVLTTAGGGVNLTAAGDITVTANINSNGGAVNITADDSATIVAGATIAAGAGNVDVRVDNADDTADTLAVLGGVTSSGLVTLAGSLTDANDVLQGSDNGDTWVTDGNATGTLNGWDFDDFAALQGGTGDDNFSVGTANFGGTLNGGEGSDTFTIANGVALTFAGTAIDGGADAAGDDTDTLDVSDYVGALAVVLTGSTATTGFAGTEATVLAGAGGEFSGIDALDASLNFGNTLTGRDVDSTWTYSSYSDGIATLLLMGEGTLIGGAGTQTLEGDDGGVDTAGS
jgi:filamentous hemagglutinin family protein